MARDKNMPWESLILGILEEGNQELQQIYASVERQYEDIYKADGINLINSDLLRVEPQWGDRPVFQHTVRSCLSRLVRLGLVHHPERGLYTLTEPGRPRLRTC